MEGGSKVRNLIWNSKTRTQCRMKDINQECIGHLKIHVNNLSIYLFIWIQKCKAISKLMRYGVIINIKYTAEKYSVSLKILSTDNLKLLAFKQ